jgi:phage repressor protein C with HTH and peptisase S24 domain
MSTDKSAAVHQTPLQTRLRDALKRKGMKEREASRAAGAGLSFVSDILTGRSKAPSMFKIMSLADALEVDAEWLVDGVEPATRAPFQASTAKVAAPIAFANTGNTIPLYAARIASDEKWVKIGDRAVGQVRPLPGLEMVEGAYAATVPNNLNAPRYFEGETIFMSPAATVKVGDFVLVRHQDETMAVGRLASIDSSGGALDLMNPDDGTLVQFDHNEIDALHKVVGSTS